MERAMSNNAARVLCCLRDDHEEHTPLYLLDMVARGIPAWRRWAFSLGAVYVALDELARLELIVDRMEPLDRRIVQAVERRFVTLNTDAFNK